MGPERKLSSFELAEWRTNVSRAFDELEITITSVGFVTPKQVQSKTIQGVGSIETVSVEKVVMADRTSEPNIPNVPKGFLPPSAAEGIINS